MYILKCVIKLKKYIHIYIHPNWFWVTHAQTDFLFFFTLRLHQQILFWSGWTGYVWLLDSSFLVWPSLPSFCAAGTPKLTTQPVFTSVSPWLALNSFSCGMTNTPMKRYNRNRRKTKSFMGSWHVCKMWLNDKNYLRIHAHFPIVHKTLVLNE